MIDGLTILLTALGLGFFAVGSLGLVRFPDTASRLHALTKADNLGLGLVALGVALQAPGLVEVIKLVLVWGLALFSAGVAAQLIGRVAARRP